MNFLLQVGGVETNINFLLDLANHPEFQAGNVHTNFIRDHYNSLFKDDSPRETHLIQAAIATILKDREEDMKEARKRNDIYNPFIVESNFRINYTHDRIIRLKYKEKGQFY